MDHISVHLIKLSKANYIKALLCKFPDFVCWEKINKTKKV